MSEYIIGVTGGVASGKSEVTRRFEMLGVVVADADLAAREAVAVGSDGLAEVVRAFGRAALAVDGIDELVDVFLPMVGPKGDGETLQDVTPQTAYVLEWTPTLSAR